MKTRIISICFDDMMEILKQGHSSLTKSASNQKRYISIKVQDKEKDDWGKDVAVLLNPAQENRGTRENPSSEDGKFIGNGIILKSTQTNTTDNPISTEYPS